jgi:hypothetical protein
VVRIRTADLSRGTAELARRAGEILAAHIAARRAEASQAGVRAADSPATGKKTKRGKKSKKAKR